jgi:hypothetical protein
LRDGTSVALKIETLYPADERIRIMVDPAVPHAFAVKLRVPAWATDPDIRASIPLDGGTLPGADGYTALRGTWARGSTIELRLKLAPRLIVGDHLNQGKVALCYGPLVLAADEALLAADGLTLNAIAIAKPDLAALAVTPEPAPAEFRTWPGAQVFRINAVARRSGKPVSVRLIGFADASATGARYKVWMPLAGVPVANLLFDGTESRSRPGNMRGSINDDDPQSGVVTFDGKGAAEDWFAVTLDAPATIRRVVFVQGKTFHDGGWFVGRPKVQIQRESNGAWEPVGEFAGYPAATATDGKKLGVGQSFTLRLPEPVKAVAVRVTGVPACGDSPKQAFAACAELQAFEN